MCSLKKKAGLPIAAGFGISSPEHVRMLDGLADVAVIGSHIITDAESGQRRHLLHMPTEA